MKLRRLLLPALLSLLLLAAVGRWLWMRSRPAVLPAYVLKGEAPVAPDAPPLPVVQPHVVLLPNGLRVFVLEDHRLPTVQFRLSLRAGRVFEPLPGLATLTAALMTEGTQSRGELALAEQTEQAGATLRVEADDERAVLRLSGPSQAAPALLSLLADVALHPAFDPARIEHVQFQKRSLDSEQNNSNRVEERLSGRRFYGETPYAAPPPSARDFEALTQADVIGFYVNHYVPNGAVLGIVGDVRSADTLALVSRLFAGWRAASGPPALPAGRFLPRTACRVSLADWPNETNSILTFQCQGVARSDPDFIALVVTNQLLGGYSSGRLDQNLRESQGYTYGASSWLDAPSWPGRWSAHATVPVEDTGATVETVFSELRRLREEPVPLAELARAKQSLVGSQTLTLERPEEQLDQMAEVYEYGLPPDYWKTFPRHIQSVTAADVQRIARTYFAEGQVQIIAIGPRDGIKGVLSRYGPVDDYDDKGYALGSGKPSNNGWPAWLHAF